MKTIFGRCGAVLALAFACQGGAALAQDASDAQLDAIIAANDSDASALALARQQAGAGDLTAAAATLERSLLLRSSPQSDDVRLYYASVLCRLGDDRRGAYQLANVRNAAAEGWAEARAACGPLPTTTSATRGNGLSGMLTLGVGYDSDALGALTPQFEILGFPTTTEEGASVVASGIINAQFASSVTGHGYAGASLISRTDISGPSVDYQTAAIWGGYARHLGGVPRNRHRRARAGCPRRTSRYSSRRRPEHTGRSFPVRCRAVRDGRGATPSRTRASRTCGCSMRRVP